MDSPARYETITVESTAQVTHIALDRPAHGNTITPALLRELAAVIDRLEADPACRLLVLKGGDGVFCTGMDLAQAVDTPAAQVQELTERYMAILTRFARSRLVVIAAVDGRVLAGGVGLAAACDLVLATPRSQLGLSEALWGLLPACVLPFLLRRVGFQPAYAMTLTTESVDAETARGLHLVDQVTEDLDDAVRRLALKLLRVDDQTVSAIKAYFRSLWLLDDAMEQRAMREAVRLMTDARVRRNLADYVAHGRYPWQR
jgi:polyketide biosynthesis enoyl-CoA hydratase PksH